MKGILICCMALFVCALSVLAAGTARCEVATLEPTQVTYIPASEGVPAGIAIVFDLTSIPDGTGRSIDEGIFDWNLGQAVGEGGYEFMAHAITATWSAAGVAQGQLPTMNEEEADAWEIEPISDRKSGGLLRLNLRVLASDWAESPSGNFGFVVLSPDLDAETLAAIGSAARLTVHYGFGN